ncbi:WD40-repeat-containing domain protein [Lactarius hengduanensis]|nr:WD40-repeat-containing domain protein [Lactarius hengduanensis]
MLGNLLRNSKRLLGQLKLDLNSFTGQASSGSNVIHNHAMVILVVAPADAGPQLGGGGISWLGKLENLSRGRHKTFKRHTKNAETRLEYIFKSTAVQRPAKLYAWRVTVRAVGRQACQASAGGEGDYIASGGLDRKLQIFSLADGRLHYSVVTPSPIKSLIWLPGPEQMLVCACNSGILINVTIFAGDTMNFTYFRADNHTIDFMAVDPSADYLATGAGVDVRIWKGDRRHDWQGRGRLTSPKKSADDVDVYVILTGLHWYSGANGTGDGNIKLITTYRHHGIQLWDVEQMAIVPIDYLDSGIVAHTYSHGLPSINDKYPATFLPRGIAFCAATADGTVTLWDATQGDRLQSVQHIRASSFVSMLSRHASQFNTHFPQAGVTIHAIAVYAAEKSGTIFLATASRDEVRVWRAISGGRNSALESLAWVTVAETVTGAVPSITLLLFGQLRLFCQRSGRPSKIVVAQRSRLRSDCDDDDDDDDDCDRNHDHDN